ncbi:helix-turn-helix domain-containing protein [Mucilaginibacter gynuensis]|uniref:Helix-turn-helix domain-containing protein n=1 Tax=Mucilaginibacter gynuensis TaxID=1302236 RepID=A0ABP8GMT9_9SPHI
MQSKRSFLYDLRHNDKLPIRIVSPEFGHLTAVEAASYKAPHHLPYYFFLFMINGSSSHTIDLNTYELGNNDLIFVMPHQIHELPVKEKGADYVKLGFDEACLSLLPKQYPFLVNPLNSQKVSFDGSAAMRVKTVLGILLELLSNWNTDPELILAHLNSLLTEINTAYFSTGQEPLTEKLSTFSAFKTLVETNFTDHPSIGQLSAELGTNINGLYQVVKQYSGLSPKEYITNRLILEARRRLYYGERSSIRELAFDLGFNDPEYFSRLFRKVTGQTIAQFSQDLSGN